LSKGQAGENGFSEPELFAGASWAIAEISLFARKRLSLDSSSSVKANAACAACAA